MRTSHVRAWIANDQLVTERAAQHPGVGAVQRQKPGLSVNRTDAVSVTARKLAVGGMVSDSAAFDIGC